ncbi:MAG: hypothetical protein LBU27_08255 [Candidatus Peribacteria bacterium]|nr:hypothetical protein [Candidatus Peribacteria bacterium]
MGSDSYGCYFQRGNNYGFANAGTISISASLVTNALSYGPSSYSDSVFRYPTD